MNKIVVTIIFLSLFAFLSTSLLFLIKFFDNEVEVVDEDLFKYVPNKEDTFREIVFNSNGSDFSGKLSNEMLNFSQALEFCSSMNMMMLDKPVKLVNFKNSEPVDDGINPESYIWINATMDESYAIRGSPKMSMILQDFQKKLAIQPVLILTKSNCYYSMKPKLTEDDWTNPDLHWKRYVYFCDEFNNTEEPVFMYRYNE